MIEKVRRELEEIKKKLYEKHEDPFIKEFNLRTVANHMFSLLERVLTKCIEIKYGVKLKKHLHGSKYLKEFSKLVNFNLNKLYEELWELRKTANYVFEIENLLEFEAKIKKWLPILEIVVNKIVNLCLNF